jgi:hypothetical protein
VSKIGTEEIPSSMGEICPRFGTNSAEFCAQFFMLLYAIICKIPGLKHSLPSIEAILCVKWWMKIQALSAL